MPVYALRCPDCSHEFKGMVLAYTKPPDIWVCSQCKGERAEPLAGHEPEPHPWDDGGHGSGCLCCAGSGRPAKR